MGPKSLAVAPVGSLNECRHVRATTITTAGLQQTVIGLRTASRQQRANCEQKQTDMGEVGIAVGMALLSNLNEANHWASIPNTRPAGDR